MATYPFTGGITGQAYAGPDWQGGLFLPDTGDIGVVVLDAPAGSGPFPELAPDGYLNALANKRGQQNVNFEVVG